VSLTAGDKVGPYEILGLVGKGGMGEVYRARDPRLNRDVAVKISSERFSERFEREARAIAALNHPNVCTLYDVGPNYLVMEYVEGEAPSGPLPLAEALTLAGQIADALEVAHAQGIVHRDLKLGNIRVKPDGTIKVLDFGLAKMGGTTPAAPSSDSPTISMAATQAGVILGTASYMAPEQARGKTVDHRADIWAFGVVLFELLTGRQLFQGEDVTETLAAVVMKDPDLGDAPVSVRRLIAVCLQKDPRKRLQAIADWRLLLSEAPSERHQTQVRTSLLGWVLAGAMLAALAVMSLIHFREQPPQRDLVRFNVFPAEGSSFRNVVSVSPNGRHITFTALASDGAARLWIRSLDSPQARMLAIADGSLTGGGAFWSPNSEFIAFVAPSGLLQKIPISGGSPQTICTLNSAIRGGAWSTNGTIIFGTATSGLQKVPSTGGNPAPLTGQNKSSTGFHGNPVFLPDGVHFLYGRASLSPDEVGIYVGSLDSPPDQQMENRLIAGVLGANYVPSQGSNSGHVLFSREGTLFAQPFDVSQLKLSGDSIPIAGDVASVGVNNPVPFSSSSTGVLAYRTGGPGAISRLLWFDRQGKQVGEVGPPNIYNTLRISDDGKTIAVNISDAQNSHVMIVDLARDGVFSRLNPGDANEVGQAISSDGRVAFSSSVGGAAGDLYFKRPGGVEAPEVMVKSPTIKHANDWSRDGKFLIYDDHHPVQRQDLWILPLEGDRKPVPFLVTSADETFGQFSPDMKWIAYSSDESGSREVYLRDFAPDHSPATVKQQSQVSKNGGDKPRWSRDGKELFYIAPDGMIMTVPVKTAATLELGVPVPLFRSQGTGFAPYDVAPDGRFLINTVQPGTAQNTSPLAVVLNWLEDLKN
jgi:serine/threonine protein kinase